MSTKARELVQSQLCKKALKFLTFITVKSVILAKVKHNCIDIALITRADELKGKVTTGGQT